MFLAILREVGHAEVMAMTAPMHHRQRFRRDERRRARSSELMTGRFAASRCQHACLFYAHSTLIAFSAASLLINRPTAAMTMPVNSGGEVLGDALI